MRSKEIKGLTEAIDRINEVAAYPTVQTAGTATQPAVQLSPDVITLQRLIQTNPSIITAYQNIDTREEFQDALQLFIQYVKYKPSSADAIALMTNAMQNLGYQ
jgi:phenolic acid decarboxylase